MMRSYICEEHIFLLCSGTWLNFLRFVSLDVVLWMCFCKLVLVSVQVSVISGEKKGNSPLDFFTFFIRFVMGFAAMLLTHFSLFWERSKSVSQRVTKLPRRCLYHNICIDVYILIIYLSTFAHMPPCFAFT